MLQMGLASGNCLDTVSSIASNGGRRTVSRTTTATATAAAAVRM
jgi:hypothetical protein